LLQKLRHAGGRSNPFVIRLSYSTQQPGDGAPRPPKRALKDGSCRMNAIKCKSSVHKEEVRGRAVACFCLLVIGYGSVSLAIDFSLRFVSFHFVTYVVRVVWHV
jgi:hypothetical protein